MAGHDGIEGFDELPGFMLANVAWGADSQVAGAAGSELEIVVGVDLFGFEHPREALHDERSHARLMSVFLDQVHDVLARNRDHFLGRESGIEQGPFGLLGSGQIRKKRDDETAWREHTHLSFGALEELGQNTHPAPPLHWMARCEIRCGGETSLARTT